MSRKNSQLWSSDMLKGIRFIYKSDIPTIEDSTKPLLHKEPYIRTYPFENEEKSLDLINKALSEDISARLPKLDLNSVLEPVKDSSLSGVCSRKYSEPNQFNNFINIFDATNFDDPFLSTELKSINDFKELETILSQQNFQEDSKPLQNYSSDQLSTVSTTKSMLNLDQIPSHSDKFMLPGTNYHENNQTVNILKPDSNSSLSSSVPNNVDAKIDNSVVILIDVANQFGFPQKFSEEILSVLKNSNHVNSKLFYRETEFLSLLKNVKILQDKYSLDVESIVYGCLYHPDYLNESWRLACLVNDVKQLGFNPDDIIRTSIRLQTKNRNEIIEALLDPSKINTKIIQKVHQAKKLDKSKSSKYGAFKKI